MSAPRAVGPVTLAATGGAGAGYALALVLVWALETTAGIDVPGSVEDAAGLLLTLALGAAGGWLVPSKRGDHV